MDQEMIKQFAPTGVLRASINTGNAVLAKALGPGQASGVSVDLATRLAQTLGVPLELVVFDKAAKSVEAVETGIADIGFFAIDPNRAEHIAFTHPYVLIEGAYVVRNNSPIRANDDVDANGIRVIVGKGSAYDLHLSRSLNKAEIIRTETSQAVVQTFLDTGVEVAAGVKQQLIADIKDKPDLRMLDGRFMVIRQAMGMHKSRGFKAIAFLRKFVEQAKAQGLVAQALEHHKISGAGIAPVADPGVEPLELD